jgi:hypothetical protein
MGVNYMDNLDLLEVLTSHWDAQPVIFQRKPINKVYKIMKVEKSHQENKKATKSTIKHNLHIPGPEISDKDGYPIESHRNPVNKHG